MLGPRELASTELARMSFLLCHFSQGHGSADDGVGEAMGEVLAELEYANSAQLNDPDFWRCLVRTQNRDVNTEFSPLALSISVQQRKAQAPSLFQPINASRSPGWTCPGRRRMSRVVVEWLFP